jgi:hypothetical protein
MEHDFEGAFGAERARANADLFARNQLRLVVAFGQPTDPIANCVVVGPWKILTRLGLLGHPSRVCGSGRHLDVSRESLEVRASHLEGR